VCISVKIIAPAQQFNVGQRLGKVIQPNWIMNAHYPIVNASMKKHTEVINCARMRRAYGPHLENLSFDEFEAGIRVEDARLAHALEFVNREGVSRNFDRHALLNPPAPILPPPHDGAVKLNNGNGRHDL
jgi:hypothetical protein